MYPATGRRNFISPVMFKVALWSLILVAEVLTGSRAQRSKPYSLEEIIVLNGIGGFGDVGKIEPSRDIVASHSALGFSLRITWEDHPGGPHYWSIRASLPPNVDMNQYDAFSCDLYVESADDRANLNLFLAESDDDRWVCWNRALKQVPFGQWEHIEIKRDKMSPWLLGNQKLEWERITSLAIEPSNGKAVFHLDNVRLQGPKDELLNIFNADDDCLHPDPRWSEPIHLPSDPGLVIFPGLSRQNLLEAGAPQKFNALLPTFSTSVWGAPSVRILTRDGIAPIYYSGFAEGCAKFLTRRQAWDVNARGESPKETSINKLYTLVGFTGWMM